MRNDFELSASCLIEVDSYKCGGHKSNPGRQSGGEIISAIDFSAGRGSSGVDLRWYHPKKFMALPAEQKDELVNWQKMQEGKKILEKSKVSADEKRKVEKMKGKSDKPKGEGNWKKKLKHAVNTQNGFKTIMSVLAAEEVSNIKWSKTLVSVTSPPPPIPTPTPTSTIATIQATLPPIPRTVAFPVSNSNFPATTLKLSTILKKSTKKH